ncbi:MAG: restriction endonuclease, partial [Weissella confusa]
STPADDLEADWTPNSDFLREIADKRINQYMETAGLPHNTQWAELGYRKSDKTWFHDYDVHEVLQRSGVKKSVVTNGNEWYETDVDTVRKAIAAVKAGQSAIDVPAPAEPKEIVLRPEQNAAVAQTKKVFAKKSGRKMLWNAKMRFGKTLT